MTLAASGTYTAVLTNEFGCDEVVTVEFTLLEATESSTTVSECDSYFWNDRGIHGVWDVRVAWRE